MVKVAIRKLVSYFQVLCYDLLSCVSSFNNTIVEGFPKKDTSQTKNYVGASFDESPPPLDLCNEK